MPINWLLRLLKIQPILDIRRKNEADARRIYALIAAMEHERDLSINAMHASVEAINLAVLQSERPTEDR